jgi:hypothetical protein
MLMAEWTSGRDRLGWHCFHGCRDILAAPLALNHHAFRAFRSGEHENQYRRRKGESNPQGKGSEVGAARPCAFPGRSFACLDFRNGNGVIDESPPSQAGRCSRSSPNPDRTFSEVCCRSAKRTRRFERSWCRERPYLLFASIGP